MRVRSILGEGFRNVVSGAARTTWFIPAAALTLVATAWLISTSITSLESAALAYRDGGATVFVAQSAGSVDGDSCERLALGTDVEISGALRDVGEVRAVNSPRSPIHLYEVTPSLFRMLGVSKVESGAVVDQTLANKLLLSGGESLTFVDGRSVTIASVAAADRPALTESALLVPSRRTSMYDACYAEFWPPPSGHTPVQLELPLTRIDEATTIGQLDTSLGESRRFDIEYAGLRLPTLITGLAASWWLIAFASTFSRRLTLAHLQMCGISFRAQLAILTVEVLTCSVASVVLASPFLAVYTLTAETSAVRALIGEWLTRGLGAGAIAAIAGTVMAAAFASERRLFSYLKS